MPSHDHHADTPTEVALSPEQTALVDRIVRDHAAAAPPGWLRIVSREECSVSAEADGTGTVQVVVVQTPAGLEQQTFRPSRTLFFENDDLLRELAAESPTQTVVLHLVIDRDGTHEARFTVDVPRVLVGVRDETSSKPVHEYLERNRAELTALLG
ncbi:hypothetical protein [Cellulomonas sp. Leaf334]|uniref:hypothetical protein n=1 Tax=Cellulomonas sp. Leaf334 TaxID=1736339 RepID=UPI0006FDC0AD|nr:hypothetical protein [Cellulomonas sp. Leaf334]KQR11775.1 hypothetical protein ASF78_11150 [Cellulomonas sp. Leaf334]